MHIRAATAEDFDQIWPIFREVSTAGETYPYPRNTTSREAERLWMAVPRGTFVAEMDGRIVGTYYIKTNQDGPGSHVCNCGYMVDPNARGRGIASALCEHSQQVAVRLGYKAMQFNLVVSTNVVAVHLWQKLGFEIVGRLPMAFDHATRGLVDAFVMYKWLEK